jgi:hypothetical protein
MDNYINLNIWEIIIFSNCPRYGIPVNRHNWFGVQRMIPNIKTPTRQLNNILEFIEFIYFLFLICFLCFNFCFD